MQVLKFGGSSVANAKNINEVIGIVQQSTKKNNNIVIILSALGGVTDALLEVATLASNTDISYKEKLHDIEHRHLTTVKELIPIDQQSSVLSMVKKTFNNIEDTCNGVYLLKELSLRTKDSIISNGEILSSQIFAGKLRSLDIENTWKDTRELIITDSQFGSATVDFITTNKNIQSFFFSLQSLICVIPGFIASDKNGNTTTLGRGGSDYTAAIIAAALNVSSVEIWTDVSGMMTADPRLVTNAKIIEKISYQEAM